MYQNEEAELFGILGCRKGEQISPLAQYWQAFLK